jgi:hypothetical protein
MNVLFNTINRLNFLIGEIPPKISEISENELSKKAAPNKWSKKEILGHLCDSAVNNHSRFVRAQFEPEPFKVARYMQDDWVRVNHYNDMPINEVLQLWKKLNEQIVRVLTKIPEAKLAVICDLGTSAPAFREDGSDRNLLWLIEDYVLHMEYHLRQIINEDWLRNEYK